MSEISPPQRPRPPVLRIVLIAGLCGAAVGLLRYSACRPTSPVPSICDTIGNKLLMADAEYKFALFAKNVAARVGVPGVASPTAWEEQAVARYEWLALAPQPDPAACHRLGIIYGKRGYLAQAWEMLMKAASLDEGDAEVYLALALVYSEEPVRRAEVRRIAGLLRRQPVWWASATLEDLARKLGSAPAEAFFREAAGRRLWRFGLALVGLLCLTWALTGASAIALLVFVVRALCNRRSAYHVPGAWAYRLRQCSWMDLLDVVALILFCNALGQVVRSALATSVAGNQALSGALPVLHYLFLILPAVALALSRSGRNWRSVLGLRAKGVLQPVLQGLFGLGMTLFAVLVVQDLLTASMRVMIPGVTPGAEGIAQSGRDDLALAPSIVRLALVVLLAPVAEEIVFRGFLYGGLLQRLQPSLAALLSAFLFAGAHLPADGSAFLSLTILGIATAYTYGLTRSLIPSVVLHSGYNACILLTLFILRM